jgi:hypothetical protein
MDIVKEVRKLRAKPTDSFVVQLATNEPERSRTCMEEIRKAMPEGWRGTIISLGPNEKIDALSLPAARELNTKLASILEQEHALDVWPGQIWESLDKRDRQSRVEIVQLKASTNQVLVKHLKTGKQTLIKMDRFRGGKRGAGYRIVQNAW